MNDERVGEWRGKWMRGERKDISVLRRVEQKLA